MRLTITIEGKRYTVSFWKWLAYQNQKQLNQIENKIDELLYKCRNECSDKSSNNGDDRSD